ncbi:transporter substrate-binding domain-containing protein [Bdellovibrio bacteriovorus]|uniref:substrate-binding periplasmic protein n=1 Tax=Bdellovibrio bacteriovorus TaxID=959 RepID=UPI0021CE28E5|nr:transporter substrate-binding domain-containing protein [Bdellovibrio bacteriovorus]UXR65445.1 transporter substrate-binding domain-containing protein [Bdellovibrio bacteriovorus]
MNSDYAMPLVDIQRSETSASLKDGILKDLGEALSKELGIPLNTLLLPKQRIAPALLSGRISLICHSSEIWQSKIKAQVFWSHDLYTSTNFVTYLKSRSPRNKKELHGERIGTVLNFIYGGLEEEFQKNLIQREDGPNIGSNVQKLLKGRVNYVLMSNLEYNYFKKSFPALQFSDFGQDSVITKCALSKKSGISLSQLNRAIDTIKKNGTLEKILKSY